MMEIILFIFFLIALIWPVGNWIERRAAKNRAEQEDEAAQDEDEEDDDEHRPTRPGGKIIHFIQL